MSLFDWSLRWGFLVLPALSIFGFFTNLTNIIVLLNPKMKDISFKYMLATSFGDLFYLFLCSYAFNYICPDCPLRDTYFTQFALIYSSNYFTSVLAIFCVFVDIFLSLLRYSILKNKTYLVSLRYYLVIPFIFLISLVYYSPVLFFSKIIPLQQNNTTPEDNTGYKVVKTSLGSSSFGQITPIVLSVVRLVLTMIVITVINVMNIVEFRKRFSSRIQNKDADRIISKTIKSSTGQDQIAINDGMNVMKRKKLKKLATNSQHASQKASRNITLMVIFQSFLYVLGTLPFLISYILSFVLPTSPQLNLFTYISRGVLYISHGTTLFLFIAFNKIFRKVLIDYLHFKF